MWCFPTYLAKNPALKKWLTHKWEEYIYSTVKSVSDKNILWDAVEAYLRGRIISYTAAYKKGLMQDFTNASEKLRRAQQQLNSPTVMNREKWH